MSDWPKHEDGSNKTVGEMTKAERDAVMAANKIRWEAKRAAADHKWEPGAYGTCKRCGTDPSISFPREQHPKSGDRTE